MENFSLYSIDGFCFPGTIILYKKHYIMSGEDGKIHFFSIKHEKSYVFDGAGGTECVQIEVLDDVLYQSCAYGEKGIYLYELDFKTIHS